MLNVGVEIVDNVGVSAPIRDYTNLAWTEAFNTKSGGKITASRSTIRDLQDGGGLLISDGDHKWSAHLTGVDKTDDGQATATFRSDLSILDDMYPHPSPDDRNLTAVTHYEALNVYAAGALADLIDKNKWQMPGLTVTSADTASSTVTNLKLRLTPSILKVVEEKGIPNNAVVTVVTDEAGGWVCHCRSGIETGHVFAKELLKIRRVKEAVTYPTVTHILAGGSGEGTARLFQTGQLPDGRQRHKFLDRRSVDTIAGLDVEIAEALDAGRRRISFQVVLADSIGYRYGHDFHIGDRARMWIDGVEYVEPISKVTTKIVGHKKTRELVVGFAAPDPMTETEAVAARAALDDLLGET